MAENAATLPLPRSAYRAEQSFERTLRAGMWLVAGLVVGLGGLAATLPVAGAIVASGEVSVASRVKRIAHPTGGVIAGIEVRDGDHVRAGQVLMRLDDTVSGANAAFSHEGMVQLLARQARLGAERDGASALVFPAALLARAADPQVEAAVLAEQRVFALRSATRQHQRSQLTEQIHASEAEIAGYRAEIESVHGQSGFIQQELDAARTLWRKGFTTLQRLNALERSAVALKGQEASLTTQIAQSRAKIAGVRQQMFAIDQDMRGQAGTELDDVTTKLSEFRQRQVTADDAQGRTSIRSPQNGIVDKLAFTTIGGVVPAGTTIMDIVPEGDRLIVRARIRPADIDQVLQGASASLRFSAFNLRTTPQINGMVDRVSADLITDDKTGSGFFVAEIVISEPERRRLGTLALRPGMPVEAFIRTKERTLLNYITKPLADQLQRAFREN